MFTIKSPKVLSKLAQGYAASESTRYAINGVQIEPHNGRALAIATDGRKLCMGLVGTADADAHKTLLAVDDVVSAGRLAKGRLLSTVRLTNGTPGRITAQGATGAVDPMPAGPETVCDEIEGNFPNYRDVCESELPTFRIAFNPALLLDALKAFVEALGEENRAVALHFTDSSKPMHLIGGSTENPLYALLMPVNAGCDADVARRGNDARKAFGLPV